MFREKKLDWHKNSDLRSDVGIVTVLNSTMCYVRAERLTRLEWEGYNQVALPVVDRASASGTQ